MAQSVIVMPEKEKNSGTINCACPIEQDTLIYNNKIPSRKVKEFEYVFKKYNA